MTWLRITRECWLSFGNHLMPPLRYHTGDLVCAPEQVAAVLVADGWCDYLFSAVVA